MARYRVLYWRNDPHPTVQEKEFRTRLGAERFKRRFVDRMFSKHLQNWTAKIERNA